MNKRLAMLEKLVEAGTADSFGQYALALEYKKEGRRKDALAAFEALRERDSSYLPMYFICADMLLEEDEEDAARVWLEQGIEVARTQGDSKTLSELETVLDGIS